MKRMTVVLALAALLSACGAQASEEDAAPSADAAAEPAEQAEPGLALADSDFGQILVDGEGRTLYRFEMDSDGVSACYDDCAGLWPPLAADDTVAGEGLDAALVGSTERDNGTAQRTYAGRPLYYYAQDAEPGDTNGHGVNDVWFVVDASGDAVTASDG